MSESTKTAATESTAVTNRDATKDTGRVSTTATTARESTKDAGRVRFGEGMMRF